jgi:hypothetical protein
VDGWTDAIFGLGVGFDVIVSIVKRLREGRDPLNSAPEILPAMTPLGVKESP